MRVRFREFTALLCFLFFFAGARGAPAGGLAAGTLIAPATEFLNGAAVVFRSLDPGQTGKVDPAKFHEQAISLVARKASEYRCPALAMSPHPQPAPLLLLPCFSQRQGGSCPPPSALDAVLKPQSGCVRSPRPPPPHRTHSTRRAHEHCV